MKKFLSSLIVLLASAPAFAMGINSNNGNTEGFPANIQKCETVDSVPPTTKSKAKVEQPFVGRIYNDEYKVYIVMDFYNKNITCPGQEIFGQNPGYFGAKRDVRKWIIEDAQVSGKTAKLVIINDYGSEDLDARLTLNHDGTFTLERISGSTMKIAVNRQWVKIPKKLVLKREH